MMASGAVTNAALLSARAAPQGHAGRSGRTESRIAAASSARGGSTFRGAAVLGRARSTRTGIRNAAVRAVAAPPAPTAPSTPPAPAAAPVPSSAWLAQPGAFNWREHWYAVAFVEDLDPKVPSAFTLLGEPLALWRDKGGEWRAFLDRCPHRLAPLTEGRVNESGELECPYHGWTFDAAGACTGIPQARAGEGVRDKRACASSLPTIVRQGILFVLPDPAALAKNPPVPLIEELDAEAGWIYIDIARDLPYSYQTLLENVVDSSHLPFTHHISVGNRANAAPLDLEVVKESPFGFAGHWEEGPRKGALGAQLTEFRAPGYMQHKLNYRKGSDASLTVVYATPSSPGRTRLLARFPFKFSFWLPKLLISNMPRWRNHQGQNGVLEDDQIFLHKQERFLERLGGKSGRGWAKHFYLPTAADKYVVAFRKWLEKHGGGDPAYAAGTDPSLPPMEPAGEKLLERYHSHTKNCVACKAALLTVRRLRAALAIGAAAAAIVAAVTGAAGVILWVTHATAAVAWTWVRGSIAALVLAAVCWAVRSGPLAKIERGFMMGEYPPPRNRIKGEPLVSELEG